MHQVLSSVVLVLAVTLVAAMPPRDNGIIFKPAIMVAEPGDAVEDVIEADVADFMPYADAKWKSCGGDGSVKINRLSIPDPFIYTQPNPLAVDLNVVKDVANFDVELRIQKKVLIWIEVPCIDVGNGTMVGSCRYDDICASMAKLPQEIQDQLAAIGLACPFKTGTNIALAKELPILPIPIELEKLLDGDYKLTLKLWKRTSKREMHLCVEVPVTLKKK